MQEIPKYTKTMCLLKYHCWNPLTDWNHISKNYNLNHLDWLSYSLEISACSNAHFFLHMHVKSRCEYKALSNMAESYIIENCYLFLHESLCSALIWYRFIVRSNAMIINFSRHLLCPLDWYVNVMFHPGKRQTMANNIKPKTFYVFIGLKGWSLYLLNTKHYMTYMI